MAGRGGVPGQGRLAQDGIALLLVLWVLVMLTVIVGQFCYTMRTETNITRNFRDSSQAVYLAKAGLNRVIYAIMNGDVDSGGQNSPWRVNADIPPQIFGKGTFTVHIGNESGRVNINSAESDLLKVLLNGLEIASKKKLVILASILDWRDRDNLHRAFGAESNYYVSLDIPYRCNNGPFNSTYELLRVRGVDREVFDRAFRDKVTVYPQNVLPEDTPYLRERRRIPSEVKPDRININAAPTSLLLALPGMDAATVDKITAYRRKKDFRSKGEISKVIGLKKYSKMADYLTLEYSPYYSVEVTGRMEDSLVSRTIKAMVYIDKKINDFKILSFELQ